MLFSYLKSKVKEGSAGDIEGLLKNRAYKAIRNIRRLQYYG